jgi:CDP-diacylglycerol--glycerol-3-phosphate 3-phosphatidyltransferase
MNQIPNLISVLRTLLALVIAYFILKKSDDNVILTAAFWLTWLIIAMDGLDGIVARKLNLSSDFGAFFDIACDRITELVYIALFVTLKWIPFWVLAIFIIRGILVDGIRAMAGKEGKTAFGEKSMMQSQLGYFLTSSRFMRGSYGIIKAFAFSLMFLAKGAYSQFLGIEMFLIYLMTFYCVIRGVPVLIEGRRYFS